MVGHKCELKDQRQVSTNEGQKLAAKWDKCCTFFEASAETKINHIECFTEGIRLYWKMHGFSMEYDSNTRNKTNRSKKIKQTLRQRFKTQKSRK